MNTLAKASIGLFAALLLMAPAQGAGWADWWVSADASSGHMNVYVAGERVITDSITGGDYGGSAYYTTCGGNDFSSVDFELTTSSGVVAGYGYNGVAIWTWNGIVFEGSATLDVTFTSAGAFSGPVSLYLDSATSDVAGLEMDLEAVGWGTGYYSYGQC